MQEQVEKKSTNKKIIMQRKIIQEQAQLEKKGCIPFWRFLRLVRVWSRDPSRGAKGCRAAGIGMGVVIAMGQE